MKIRIFSPAFNAKATLPALLEELDDVAATLKRHGDQMSVLIINDASTDGTGDLLNLATSHYEWLKVQDNEKNIGNAGNIIAGYQWGAGSNADVVGCLDSDGEHSPYAMIRHLRMIERGECDGVSGSIIFPDHTSNHNDRNMMRFWGGMQASMAGVDGMFYIQSPGYNLHRTEKVVTALELFHQYQDYFNGESGQGSMPRWGMHGVMIHLLAKGAGSRIKAAYLECFGQSPNRSPDKLWQQANAASTHAGMLTKFMATQAK